MNSIDELLAEINEILREHELGQALEAFSAYNWPFEPTAEDRRTYVYRYICGPSPDDDPELLEWLDRVYDETIQLHELHFGRLYGGQLGGN